MHEIASTEKHMADILVVDDEQDSLKLIERVLAREGFVVHCVTNGKEALAKIMEKTISLIITDLNMPEMNGFELSRKTMEIAPQIPIIMITGNASPEISRQATDIGISKVLTKPFQIKMMLNAIKCVMGNLIILSCM